MKNSVKIIKLKKMLNNTSMTLENNYNIKNINRYSQPLKNSISKAYENRKASSVNNYKNNLDNLFDKQIVDFSYIDELNKKKINLKHKNKNNTSTNESIIMEWVKDLLRWEDLFLKLENKLGFYPTIDFFTKGIIDLTSEIKERLAIGKISKEILIKRSLKLIISIAKRYNGCGLSFEDLIAEGILGLMKGIRKYDFSKGHKFSTYAHWWIRQSISRSIDDQSRIIRLPVYVKEILSKINKIKNKFYEDKKRYPTEEEISLLIGIPLKKLRKLLLSCNDLISLDSLIENDSNDSNMLNDSIEDSKVINSEVYAIEKSLKQDLNKALLTLSDRESAVIRLRYGLDDGNERTLEEIGEYLNVTRERARQIEIKALKKLQFNTSNYLFSDYEE
ncbi:sigma 2 transcription factor (nucleomorph) [Bigelowiella natans]|uniref:Sigma 2 transcription factor n=1 Tax=Bigelowiella natans TaxID=227086 RepID=Q3LW61_BIGNA|nr:sigma 2 transcription factor [Bigelowiella natans]ABA27305.1 sigma 2 transcription factor [Bigelowiella natans]